MEYKLTDSETKKVLECCSKDDCDNCPNDFGNCYANLAGYALDLINRLEAENRNLISEVNLYRQEVERMQMEQFIAKFEKHKDLKNAKVEAVKEFEEKAKEELAEWIGADNSITYSRIERVLDNLAKEMGKKYNDNRADN